MRGTLSASNRELNRSLCFGRKRYATLSDSQECLGRKHALLRAQKGVIKATVPVEFVHFSCLEGMGASVWPFAVDPSRSPAGMI